jgi:hypothetical protein
VLRAYCSVVQFYADGYIETVVSMLALPRNLLVDILAGSEAEYVNRGAQTAGNSRPAEAKRLIAHVLR